jgi:hypothetical protein
VKLTTDGTIVLANETTTGPSTGFAGVFLGCTYTDSTSNQVRFQQYYPGGITPATGTFINAIIADDPDTLFKMAVVSGTTVVTGIQYTGIGQNSTLVQNTGIHSYWKLASGVVGCNRLRLRRCPFVSLTLFKTLHMFLVVTFCSQK